MIDVLYPMTLWRLHNNLDKMAYGKLSYKEKSNLIDSIPESLNQAETYADNILIEFIKEKEKTIGMDMYKALCRRMATENAKKMYVLRCYIASAKIYAEPDKIEIYSNKMMDTLDFPKQKAIEENPETNLGGETSPHPLMIPPGALASDIPPNSTLVFSKHDESKITERDVLPDNMMPKISDILFSYGLEVNKDNVWSILSDISMSSSINDRIVARILYLITNAEVRKQPLSLLPVRIKREDK